MVPWVPYNPDFYLPGVPVACFQVFGATRWYPSRVRMVRYGCDDELRMGLIAEDRPNTGSIRGKSGPKVDKSRFMENGPFVRSKPSIANAMNAGVENHAKGGYHAALSNARPAQN